MKVDDKKRQLGECTQKDMRKGQNTTKHRRIQKRKIIIQAGFIIKLLSSKMLVF